MRDGPDLNAKYFTDAGIDLKQLLYFVVVVDQMSFSKAAAVLYVTQPLLSQRIAALEKTLGCQLLIRGHRGIQLTPAGEVLAERAREIISLTNDLTFAVRRAASTSQPVGELSVAMDSLLPDALLTRAVTAYKRSYLRIVFSMLCREGSEVLQLVENGGADVGILPVTARRLAPGIAERVVGQDTLCFVASERLAQTATLEEFIWLANRFPTVMPEGNRLCTERARAIYGQLGIAPDFRYRANLRDVVMQIECAMGVGLLPGGNLTAWSERHLTGYPLRGIPSAELQVAAYWRSEAPNPLVLAFLDTLADCAAQPE